MSRWHPHKSQIDGFFYSNIPLTNTEIDILFEAMQVYGGLIWPLAHKIYTNPLCKRRLVCCNKTQQSILKYINIEKELKIWGLVIRLPLAGIIIDDLLRLI